MHTYIFIYVYIYAFSSLHPIIFFIQCISCLSYTSSSKRSVVHLKCHSTFDVAPPHFIQLNHIMIKHNLSLQLLALQWCMPYNRRTSFAYVRRCHPLSLHFLGRSLLALLQPQCLVCPNRHTQARVFLQPQLSKRFVVVILARVVVLRWLLTFIELHLLSWLVRRCQHFALAPFYSPKCKVLPLGGGAKVRPRCQRSWRVLGLALQAVPLRRYRTHQAAKRQRRKNRGCCNLHVLVLGSGSCSLKSSRSPYL